MSHANGLDKESTQATSVPVVIDEDQLDHEKERKKQKKTDAPTYNKRIQEVYTFSNSQQNGLGSVETDEETNKTKKESSVRWATNA